MRIQKHGIAAPVFTGLIDDLSLEHQIELTAQMLVSDKSIAGCIGSDPVEHKLASAFTRQPAERKAVAKLAPGKARDRFVVQLETQEVG